MASVVIPDSVTRIPDSAFAGCESLASFTLPASLEIIEDRAFNACTGLKKITVPRSVSFIGENVFDYCDALEEIYYLGSEEEWYLIDYKDRSDEVMSKVKYADATKSIRGACVELRYEDASGETYTGRPITPEVKVTLSGSVLEKDKDYTVSYSNNTNAGTAAVTVAGIGTYKGSVSTEFEILKADQTITASNFSLTFPEGGKIRTSGNKGALTYTDTAANTNGAKYTYKIVAKGSTGNSTLSKSLTTYRLVRPAVGSPVNSAAGKMTVKWGKNAKATGYQIQYSTSKTFASSNKTVNITKAATLSRVIAGLAKGKTYYVRIRTYKTAGSTKYWSAWSAKKSVKISK